MNKELGTLFVRLLLGIIFLLQGYGKVFNWGVDNLYEMSFFKGDFEGVLPLGFVKIVAYYTSFTELIAGGLLLIGLRVKLSILLLSSVILIVSFGHGLIQPIWDLSHVMFRSILIIAMFFIPREWDKYSLDNYLQCKFSSN